MPKKNSSGIDNLLAALDKEQAANSDGSLEGTIDRIVAPLALTGRQVEPQVVGSFADQMARPTPIAMTPTMQAENVLANAGTPLRLAGIKAPVPPELAPEPSPRPTTEGMLVPNPNYETVAGEAAREIATQKASPQNLLETKNPSLFALNLANEVSGRAGYPQMLKGGKELLAGGIEPGIADVGEGAFKAATPLLIGAGVAQPVRVATGLAGAVAAGFAAQKAAEAAGANDDEQRIANLVGSLAGGALTGGKGGFFDRAAKVPEASIDHLPGLKASLEKAAAANAEPTPATLDSTPALRAALEKESGSVGAASASDNLSNFAANVNLDRLNTAKDVRSLIKDTAAASGDFMAQRRGVVTHAETAAAAEQLGLTPEKLAKLRPGTALNDAELLAARRINVATSEDALAAAKAFRANDSSENLLAFQTAMQRHVAVLNAVSGASSEAG